MKRYLAFFGEDYYPMGGMGDFVGDFDNYEEALNTIGVIHSKSRHAEEPRGQQWELCWAHIYDTKENKRVFDTMDSIK